MSVPAAKDSRSGFTVTALKPGIGAEVTGIDLGRPIGPAVQRALYDAVVEHVALVVRGQQLTPAEFATAAERFGKLMPDQIQTALAAGVPMVSILDNFEKDSRGNQAKTPKNATWHTDHTNKKRPPKFTFLYAEAVPSRGGGTAVVNMHAAYEALTPARRAELDRLETANHRVSTARLDIANPDIVAEQERLAEPLVIHPLVRTHPERGTRAIWFHTGKTETVTGMDPYETQAFLEGLLAETIRAEFTYVHDWRIGDLLIIDNRTAMHRALADYDMSEHRKLYRTMVRGERPV